MKIDYSTIFHIADDGVYYVDGVIPYDSLIPDEKGFHGEQTYQNGEFCVRLYSNAEICIVFPTSSFGKEDALKKARAKSCSLVLFLKEKGVIIKN
ncbi:MAG: hypothetical protein IJY84_01575 [Clostridia bacterium]|nr:hypothetical protein [Clostridia bacterium]